MKNNNEVEIFYDVDNHEVKRIYKIPVGGKNSKKAEKEISKLISDYKQEIILNDIKSENQVDDTDEYWFPINTKKDSN